MVYTIVPYTLWCGPPYPIHHTSYIMCAWCSGLPTLHGTWSSGSSYLSSRGRDSGDVGRQTIRAILLAGEHTPQCLCTKEVCRTTTCSPCVHVEQGVYGAPCIP